ncbi:hypothetical protein DFJ77DRAFT_462743 [Powellomyces hirtus]|nr:hypothetical protein DFJ77DRAFT_462743 [Powellomyces hirtus]
MSPDTPLVKYDITSLPGTDKLYEITWLSNSQTVRVRTGDSTFHGKGLFCAQELIPAETNIDHYHGQTMTSREAHLKHASNDDSFSLMTGWVIVPQPHIPGRYINDSVRLPDNDDGEIIYTCPANATFTESSTGTVIVKAIRDIRMDEEVIISYGEWYWRGVLFERSGFEDAPPRFAALRKDDPADQKVKAAWMKKLKWETLPDDIRIVKVERKNSGGSAKHWDFYLIKKHTMGVWRSAKQYSLHLQNIDDATLEDPCPCEVCVKKQPGPKANKNKRKRDNDENAVDNSTSTASTTDGAGVTAHIGMRSSMGIPQGTRISVDATSPSSSNILDRLKPKVTRTEAESSASAALTSATPPITVIVPSKITTTTTRTSAFSPPSSSQTQIVPSGSATREDEDKEKGEKTKTTDGDAEADRHHMRTAIAEARKCIPVETAYNVGAVIVEPSTNTVLAQAHSRELPGNTHAEECCLMKLAENITNNNNNVLKSATIYTTMEPCAERLSGNRPCAHRLRDVSIKRVVVGVREPPHFIAACQGTTLLREAGIVVDYLDGFQDEIEAMNKHIGT